MSRQSFAAPPLPVLLTRPAPQAVRFAAELAARFGTDIRPVIAPLMQSLPLPLPRAILPAAALILTSETGAKYAGQVRSLLPDFAYCVGDRTAEVARDCGFEAVSAQGAAADLIALILASPDQGPLLYLHGKNRAADVAAALAPYGRQVISLPIYEQKPQPLTVEALALLRDVGPVLLPLFSPRSARLFFEAAGPIAADLHPVVISENTLHQLPESWAARAVVASRPDAAAMLVAIARQLSCGLT